MSKILLETNKLKKTFNHSSGSITLFDNLDLKIREGELVAYRPSGSGKSSITFIIYDEPSREILKLIITRQRTYQTIKKMI